MSSPASIRVGPFSTNVLVKKRYIIIYLFIVFMSIFTVQYEFWVYWKLISVNREPFLFYVFLPLLLFIMYVSLTLISLIYSKIILSIINRIHPPREGTFVRDSSDKDYCYWCLRHVVKKWPVLLAHKFPFPFLDNLCFKLFGVKTSFSNSLFEGWVDTEFIEFGDGVVVGQASIVHSSIIIGNLLIIRKTVIEDNAHIGAHTVVMPGTHMKKNSILAANSITTVSQELEADWVYLGLPAKKYKKNKFNEEGLENLLENYVSNVNEVREKYEELYMKRHDKNLSFREKFQQRLNTIQHEKGRYKSVEEKTREKEKKKTTDKLKNIIKKEINLQYHWYLLGFILIYYSGFFIPATVTIVFHFLFYKPYFLDVNNVQSLILSQRPLITSLFLPAVLITGVVLHLVFVALSTKGVWGLTEKLSPSQEGIIPRGIPSKTLNFYHIRSFIIKYGKRAFQKGPFPWLITWFYNFVGSNSIGKGTTIEEQFGCDRFVEIGDNSYIGVYSAISSHLVEGIFGNLSYFKIKIGDNVTTTAMNCIGPGTKLNDNTYLFPMASSPKHSTYKGDNYYFGAPARRIFSRKVMRYLDIEKDDLEKNTGKS
ncbi:MAG: DapH/DapD/GlmU-related protein [Promethearchaeia archaeon]